MEIIPTKAQERVINTHENCVVIACPGSGKTFVLSEKIKSILPELPRYRGVIAISYTNKASSELERRCLTAGIDRKGSFFGTIHKFCQSEIIIPFGKQVFGIPENCLKIQKKANLSQEEHKNFEFIRGNDLSLEIFEQYVEIFKSYFLKGILLLESTGAFALYILSKSKACRNYLTARYSHLIIDEYQHSGFEQHLMLLKLSELGLIAIAVGDTDQSIYAYDGKSSEYLLSLATENTNFNLFSLEKNHRCHPSIINYSLRLLNKKSNLLETDEIRVYEKSIIGDEEMISKWIDKHISKICDHFGLSKMNNVGILTRTNRTSELVSRYIKTKHKLFINDELENHFSLWSNLFCGILSILLDPAAYKFDLITDYLKENIEDTKSRKVYSILNKLDLQNEFDTTTVVQKYVEIAQIIFPNLENADSIQILTNILNSVERIRRFKPAEDDEIQIMTLHKAKGLEFDIVFHLDLHEYVFPSKNYKNNPPTYPSWQQDLNLHYVGITRARKACYLLINNQRHNKRMEKWSGNPSEFLSINNLSQIRKRL